jgi:ubiquinone/menaquinone biosynthesis C-methylase UbiE
MLRNASARVGGSAALGAAPAEALPLRDGAFDTVVSASSFHYWPAPLDGLREARRVLRPSGRLVVADWAREFTTMRVMDAWLRLTGHAMARIYTENEFRAMLGEAGFQVVGARRAKIGAVWGLWVVEARSG